MRPHSIALQSLITHLAALPGVQRVVLDERATVLVVVCDRTAHCHEIQEVADRRIADLGLAGLDVEVAFRATEHREERRIRFRDVTRQEQPDRTLLVTVTLEWLGRPVSATAPAERGEPPELRAVAIATVDAVNAIVERDLQLRVAGIKRVRSFDVDLMVASLFCTGESRQQLVGAVVAGDDPFGAACRAVLNALNRLLGNFLSR